MSADLRAHRAQTLSIGGATYDLFLTMKKNLTADHSAINLQIGHKLGVDAVIETCGGGASNTSVAFARLGLNAAFCGVLGSDQWGERLLGAMQKEGVNTAPATIVDDETSSFSIILSLASGERTILHAPGVSEHLQDMTLDLEAVKSANVVYLNHLHETSCMIEDDVTKAILARPDIHLTWNPGGCQIDAGMDAKDKAELLKATDLLLLNKEEAFEFTKTKTIPDALKKLIAAGAKNVCITDGKHGVTASDGKHTYHCPVLADTKVVDTTGAGDAFGAAATWALLRGESLQKALICGTLSAASVVGAIGAQAGLLTENQMQEKVSTTALEVRILD